MPRYFYDLYFEGEYVETITVEAPNEEDSQRYADAEMNPADQPGWEAKFSGEVHEFDDTSE